jgi:hypothetical protein
MTKDDAGNLAFAKREWAKTLRRSKADALQVIAADDDDQAAEAISKYVLLLPSERRPQEALPLLEAAKPATFWKAFNDCWNIFDDTWQFVPRLLSALRRNAKLAPPYIYMPQESVKIFDALPDEVQVFRGCSRERVAGLSWSLNRDVATGFTHGHRGIVVPNPAIAEATISKRDIFALMTSRAAQELVLDPNKLTDIKVIGLEQ